MDLHIETLLIEHSQQKEKQSVFVGLLRAFSNEKSHKINFDSPENVQFFDELLSIEWIPVYVDPPDEFLPWKLGDRNILTAARYSRPPSDRWLCSYSYGISIIEVRNETLLKVLKWDLPVPSQVVATQLRAMAAAHQSECEKLKQSQTEEKKESQVDEDTANVDEIRLNQKMTSVIPKIYTILYRSVRNPEITTIQRILHGTPWVWIGNRFVLTEQVALDCPSGAHPYLYALPTDLAPFSNLLQFLGVRNKFSDNDYVSTLKRMKHDFGDRPIPPRLVSLAIYLTQQLSDRVIRVGDWDICVPDENCVMTSAVDLVFNDAPWMGCSTSSTKETPILLVHPKISNEVAEKVGARSLRNSLVQDNIMEFDALDRAEAFGQVEDLTRRLRNILELYPEGSGILSELIQNADDALATEVSVLFSTRRHGTSSLLNESMKPWQQTPSLYFFNNAMFSDQDFRNLSRIGQGSKLDRLATTGRFGLGFNAVYHFTDIPSLVSKDYLIIFDPHTKYVPGAEPAKPGLKINFTGSRLLDQFPDQFSPYLKFGCDMRSRFQGTLFRFPLRTSSLARNSEIKQQALSSHEIFQMLENFRAAASQMLLFLRNVTKITVFIEDEDGLQSMSATPAVPALVPSPIPTTSVQVPDQDDVPSLPLATITHSANLSAQDIISCSVVPCFSSSPEYFFGVQVIKRVSINGEPWNKLTLFLFGTEDPSLVSKDVCFERMLATQDKELPRITHIVDIHVVSPGKSKHIRSNEQKDDAEEEVCATRIIDRFLVCQRLGAGRAKQIACENRNLKLLPWVGVAAHLSHMKLRDLGFIPSDEEIIQFALQTAELARDEKPILIRSESGSGVFGPSDQLKIRNLVDHHKIYPPTAGRAFCFLPLPITTSLPVHINGYFELSANRRDIWYGEGMSGEGEIRSNWNYHLLSDAVSLAYMRILLEAIPILGPTPAFFSLFPVEIPREPWNTCILHLYKLIPSFEILYTKLGNQGKGRWVKPADAILMDTSLQSDDNDQDAIMMEQLLLEEKLPIVRLPARVQKLFVKYAEAQICVLDANFLRRHLATRIDHPCLGNIRLSSNTLESKQETDQPSQEEEKTVDTINTGQNLPANRHKALSFLLQYCAADILKDRSGESFSKLVDLPLIPLLDGSIGVFANPNSPNAYLCNSIERKLLASAPHLIVDDECTDEIKKIFENKYLSHYTSVQKMSYEHMASFALPIMFPNLYRSRGQEILFSESNVSLEWLKLLWYYLSECDMLDPFHGWPLIPCTNEKNQSILCPLDPNSVVITREGLDDNLVKLFAQLRLRPLNLDILSPGNLLKRNVSPFTPESTSGPLELTQAMKLLSNNYIHKPDLVGIIEALCVISSNSMKEITRKISNCGVEQKRSLRNFLAQEIENMKSSREELTDHHKMVLKALPIYEVFYHTNVGGRIGRLSHYHSHPRFDTLEKEKYFAPQSIPYSVLNDDFVFVEPNQYELSNMLKKLQVRQISLSNFYKTYIFPRLHEFEDEVRNRVMKHCINHLSDLKEHDPEIISVLKNVEFVPTPQGRLEAPCNLFDPEIKEIAILLDHETQYPDENFRIESIKLLQLGMKQHLDRQAVINCARSIQRLGARNPELAVKRGEKLLEYVGFALDKLLSEDIREFGRTNNPAQAERSEYFIELSKIPWVPIRQLPSTVGLPWNEELLRNSVVLAPCEIRPESYEWLCSFSYGILATETPNKKVCHQLGWDEPLRLGVLALQLVEILRAFENNVSIDVRQHLNNELPRLYNALAAAINDPHNVERLKAAVSNKAWIWVNEKFVSEDEIAFSSAIDETEPYLYVVREEMQSFAPLLTCMGVANEFSNAQYLRVLQRLAPNSALTKKQLDIALTILNYIESVELEPSDIYGAMVPLVANKNDDVFLAPATSVFFNDANWLHVKNTGNIMFLHERVSETAAYKVGVKSLREWIISSIQAGKTEEITCINSDEWVEFCHRFPFHLMDAMSDIVEMADVLRCPRIEVAIDFTSYGSQSLLNPGLQLLQNAAICIFMDNIVLDNRLIEYLIAPPSPQQRKEVEGRFFRFGSGLTSSFYLTDCIQILTGGRFVILDPMGKYLIDLQNKSTSQNKSTGKCYDLADSDIVKRFPHQFDPFRVMVPDIRGQTTCIRLPLRHNRHGMSQQLWGQSRIIELMNTFSQQTQAVLPFCSSLQDVSCWCVNPPVIPSVDSARIRILLARALIPPDRINRDLLNCRQELQMCTNWRRNAISAFLSRQEEKAVCYELPIQIFVHENLKNFLETAFTSIESINADLDHIEEKSHYNEGNDSNQEKQTDSTQLLEQEEEKENGKCLQSQEDSTSKKNEREGTNLDEANSSTTNSLLITQLSETPCTVHNDLWIVSSVLEHEHIREFAMSKRCEMLDGPKHNLIPFVSVACCISRDGSLPNDQCVAQPSSVYINAGQTSCKSGLPVLVGGHFEILPYSRDLWSHSTARDLDTSDILSGLRVEWNALLFRFGVTRAYGKLFMQLSRTINHNSNCLTEKELVDWLEIASSKKQEHKSREIGTKNENSILHKKTSTHDQASGKEDEESDESENEEPTASTQVLPLKRSVSEPNVCSSTYSRMYGYWPLRSNLSVTASQFLANHLYDELMSLPIFMTINGESLVAEAGFFPDGRLGELLEGFMNTLLPLFRIPHFMNDDFADSTGGRKLKKINESVVRRLLRTKEDILVNIDRMVDPLAFVSALFDYCTRDLNDSNFEELQLLPIIFLSSGRVARSNKSKTYYIAKPVEQALLPILQESFIHPIFMSRFREYFARREFRQALRISNFDFEVLSKHMRHIIPQDFSDRIDATIDSMPMIGTLSFREWLSLFWSIVPLKDDSIRKLFDPWPLLPLTTGRLLPVRCSSFVLALSPADIDSHVLQRREEIEKQIQNRWTEDRAPTKEPILVETETKEEKGDEHESKGEELQPKHPPASTISDSISIFDSLKTDSGVQLLHRLMKSINMTLLDLSFFPRQEWPLPNSFARSPHTVIHALSRMLENMPHLYGQLDWKQLGNDDYNALLHILQQACQKEGYSAVERSQIRNLPIFETIDGQRVSLSMRENKMILERDFEELSALGHLPNASNFLRATNEELLLDLGVKQVTKVDLLCNHLLPDFNFMEKQQKWRLLCFVLKSWDNLRALDSQNQLLDAFKSLAFLPVNTFLPITKTSEADEKYSTFFEFAEMPIEFSHYEVFASPKSLLCPSSESLIFLFGDIPSKFPAAPFCTSSWLAILKTLDIQQTVDRNLFKECAQHIESRAVSETLTRSQSNRNVATNRNSSALTEVLQKVGLVQSRESFIPCSALLREKGEYLVKLLLNQMEIFHSTEFYDSIKDIRFVPAHLPLYPNGASRFQEDLQDVSLSMPDTDVGLESFNNCCLSHHRDLCFTVRSCLPPELDPPNVMHRGLNIVSVLPQNVVIEHFFNVVGDESVLENWCYSSSAQLVFSGIFGYFQDKWAQLPDLVKKQLCRIPCIPIGNSFIKARRVFIRLDQDLSPYLFEVPRHFGPYDTLFRNIGVKSEPEIQDFREFLEELKAECGTMSMNPNELSAVLKVIMLLGKADQEVSRETTRNLIQYVPDEAAVLVPVAQCFFNDAPWIAQRLNSHIVRLINYRVSLALCKKIGVRKISEVVRENLDSDFAMEHCSELDSLARQINDAMTSRQLLDSLVQILAHQAAELGSTSDALKGLSSLSEEDREIPPLIQSIAQYRVQFVRSIRSHFFIGSRDVTVQPEGSMFFVDAKNKIIYLAPANGMRSEQLLALAVNQILGNELRDLMPLEALLACTPGNMSQTLGFFSIRSVGEETKRRGVPGEILVDTDMALVELRPLRTFLKGEIVAYERQGVLRYAVVLGEDQEESKSNRQIIKQVRLQTSPTQVDVLLSTQIYTFRATRSVNIDSIQGISLFFFFNKKI